MQLSYPTLPYPPLTQGWRLLPGSALIAVALGQCVAVCFKGGGVAGCDSGELVVHYTSLVVLRLFFNRLTNQR